MSKHKKLYQKVNVKPKKFGNRNTNAINIIINPDENEDMYNKTPSFRPSNILNTIREQPREVDPSSKQMILGRAMREDVPITGTQLDELENNRVNQEQLNLMELEERFNVQQQQVDQDREMMGNRLEEMRQTLAEDRATANVHNQYVTDYVDTLFDYRDRLDNERDEQRDRSPENPQQYLDANYPRPDELNDPIMQQLDEIQQFVKGMHEEEEINAMQKDEQPSSSPRMKEFTKRLQHLDKAYGASDIYIKRFANSNQTDDDWQTFTDNIEPLYEEEAQLFADAKAANNAGDSTALKMINEDNKQREKLKAFVNEQVRIGNRPFKKYNRN